jgi:hypothetical protein
LTGCPVERDHLVGCLSSQAPRVAIANFSSHLDRSNPSAELLSDAVSVSATSHDPLIRTARSIMSRHPQPDGVVQRTLGDQTELAPEVPAQQVIEPTGERRRRLTGCDSLRSSAPKTETVSIASADGIRNARLPLYSLLY